MLEKITKSILAHIPGSPVNLAQQKRQMERRLRAEGHSRLEAATLVSKHFKKTIDIK